MEENNEEVKAYSKVPAKVNMWSSFKNFWLTPIELELTPKQRKVFQEVHDFWHQEIYFENGGLYLRKPACEGIEDEEPKINITL